MKSFVWFVLGLGGGFVLAHLVNKDPRGHELLAQVDARIGEFTDRVTDAYHEQEARFAGFVDDARDAAAAAAASVSDTASGVVDAAKGAASDAVDAVADAAPGATPKTSD